MDKGNMYAGNIPKEINVSQVTIKDDFWSKTQKLVTDVVIPFQEDVLNDRVEGVEKSHAIENFRIAAGESKGEFYGMVFQDSDLAKWIEGVGYSLAIKPDKELEERTDAIIDTIAKAQQEDGYLNTYFTVKEPEKRWQNLLECHELYCAGHMMEAAVAYYEATGKDKLLHVMERMAHHIAERFGADKERGIPGHQEIEIGLMKMYKTTRKQEYKDLARYFIDERGRNPDYFKEELEKRGWVHFGQYGMDAEDTQYNQSHTTVYEQKEAVGHSVRAVYMYTAMADLAAEDKDERLFEACETLWNNMVNKRMYITGGIGSTVAGEAFSIDYDLPNDTVYAETCASIGLVFFAKQMLKSRVDGKYADVMERALYNGIISGMQLDGKKFFYVNPLEVNPGISGVLYGHKHVLLERPGWYACACCPPNLVRMMTSLGKYAWDESEDTIYSHLFIGQDARLEKADITVESRYPWTGEIDYKVMSKSDKPFTVAIHIPGYIKDEKVTVNGEVFDIESNKKDGYLYIHRIWADADSIEIRFALPVRKIYANQKVIEDAGCVALMRGPVVYCFEGIDNGSNLQSIRISDIENAKISMADEGVLSGNVILKLKGSKLVSSEELYSEEPPKVEEVSITAIPYYTWGNRGVNQMRVWMQEEIAMTKSERIISSW